MMWNYNMIINCGAGWAGANPPKSTDHSRGLGVQGVTKVRVKRPFRPIFSSFPRQTMIRRLRRPVRVATPMSFFSTTFSSFSSTTTSSSSTATTNTTNYSDPDFTDTQTAYSGLSTSKLVRGWAVLKICSIDAIVVNSEYLLATSRYC